MSQSEKESILEEALSLLITDRIEVQLINLDHLGYYDLLTGHVLQTSLGSFKGGITSFYEAIKGGNNSNDLNSMHMRFMLRCINSEYIMTAAEQIFQTVVDNLSNNYIDLSYDLKTGDKVMDLSKMEKVLLLLHVYEDRIAVAVATHKVDMAVQAALVAARNKAEKRK